MAEENKRPRQPAGTGEKPQERKKDGKGKESKSKVEVLLITGMSGAGKTQAVNALEDIGYFCVDNLPPNLFLRFVEGLLLSQNPISQVALVVDVRNGAFFYQLEEALDEIEDIVDCRVLYLEASDEVLVRRFKETRRRHPLAGTEDSILHSIAKEREILTNIRGRADFIIDTSNLTAMELNQEISGIFFRREQDRMLISLMSFGYKYGLPIEADLVVDVRFLPNPFYVAELRQLTGLDKPIRDFVFRYEVSKNFVRKYTALLRFLLPHYLQEGKKHLTIAVGCTGGRHRSVAIAEALRKRLATHGYEPTVYHRDIKKANKKTEKG